MITWIKLSEMLWNFLAGLQHQRGDDETRLTGSVYPTPHSTSSWPVAHRCNVVGTITARPATNWGRASRLGCCFTGSLKKKSIKMSFTKSNSSCHVEEMLTPSLKKFWRHEWWYICNVPLIKKKQIRYRPNSHGGHFPSDIWKSYKRIYLTNSYDCTTFLLISTWKDSWH